LVHALSNPDTSDLPRVISADPSLTLHVVRVANSAYYGAAKNVRSVDDAILRIGLREVWAIAAAIKAKEMFDVAKNWSDLKDTLWHHAISVGAAARCLSRNFAPRDAEVFFTAGILHDVGKLVLACFDPAYVQLCKSGALYGKELVSTENAAYQTTHALLGGSLIAHWNLPDTLMKLVGQHHDPVTDDDKNKRAKLMLSAANDMGHAPAKTLADALAYFDKHYPPAATRLGIEKPTFFAMVKDWHRQVEMLTNI
jgi:HD-like signal output (HDOD) protein